MLVVVTEAVGVLLGDGDGEFVGVFVGVGVMEFVGVCVGVFVSVEVGEFVGVSVGVLVIVGPVVNVGVGAIGLQLITIFFDVAEATTSAQPFAVTIALSPELRTRVKAAFAS